MKSSAIEVRVNERESAQYFSNAAALYVLGVGFGIFAAKAQSAFIGGICFWMSVFFLCDCFRLARACRRLDTSGNLLLTLTPEGFTHYGSWVHPEKVSWKQVTGLRYFKTPHSETCYFQAVGGQNLFRFALFGTPKYELPLAVIKGGKEALHEILGTFPKASHLAPEKPALPELRQAA